MINTAVFGRDHPEVAKALINLGIVQLRLREQRAAQANLDRALAISEVAYGPDHREAVKALIGLSVIHGERIAEYLISISLALMSATVRRNPEG